MALLSDYRKRIEAVMAHKVPRVKINGIGLPWQFIKQRKTKHTFDYAFEVPTGYAANDLEKHSDALFASCGSIVAIKDRAGIVVVTVYPGDFPILLPFDAKMLDMTKDRDVLLGYDREMKPVIHSFDIPHMLIAGQSGYGKTDAVRWILYQLINRFTPEQLEIQIIDMKGFSFLPFQRIPHITRIVTELPEAVEVLEDAYQTMKERSQAVIHSGNRELVKSFKWKIVLIDEASQIAPELVTKYDKPLANQAAQRASAISCVGREAGVGLIYATQYPTAEVIHGQIRANMEAVLCFKTENSVHSNVALGSSGAEKITAQGRAFYKSRKGLAMIQVPYVGDDPVWDRLLSSYKGVKSFEQRGEEKSNTQDDGDDTDCLNGSSGEVLSWDRFPTEKSVRNSKDVGTREDDRGGEKKDRRDKGLEAG